MFKETLQSIVAKTDSSLGALIMGADGLSVERFFNDEGEEANLDVTTIFFPLFRVERVYLDEPSGSIKSYAQRFHEVTGMAIPTYLGLERGH